MPVSWQEWIDWVSTNSPSTPINEANYNAYVERAQENDLRSGDPGHDGTTPPEDGQQNAEMLAYNQYKDNGGTLPIDGWRAAGKPPGAAGPDQPGVRPPTFGTWLQGQGYTRQSWDALSTTEQNALKGTFGDTYDYHDDWQQQLINMTGLGDDPVIDDTTTDDTTDDFSQQLAAAVSGYERQIAEATALQRAEATRLGARQAGHAERSAKEAWLGGGGAAGEFEQRYAGAGEAGGRSLNDLLQALNVSERQQLAGAKQFGIGTMISGEELGLRQQQMAQQMGQYQQSFAEQRRQFGVGTGLSQQQLAQQAQYQQGQLGLGQQQAQAGIWGPLFGALGTIGGGVIGNLLAPGAGTAPGAAAGSQIGTAVGSWFG